MTSTDQSGYARSQSGAWLSIVAYILLSSAKLGIGWWAGSKALTADGVNNLTDIIGSVAVLLGLRIADRPADEDHRYGHRKAETVAAVVVASVMGLVGLDVAVDAARAAFRPDLEVPHPLAIWTGLASALVMLGVYQYNIRLARRTGSKALAAAAFDNRSDAFTALGAVVGIVGAQLGWRWLDPVAGVAVAFVIIHTAWHIGAEAAHTLTDGFNTGDLRAIRERVAGVAGVVRVHDVKARHLGDAVAVDVTIGVRPTMSVADAHVVSDDVEQSLQGYMRIIHVHVHTEPAGKRK